MSVSRESPEEKKKNEEMRRKELDKMKQCKSGKDSNPPVQPGSSGVGHIIDPILPLGTAGMKNKFRLLGVIESKNY